MTKTEEEESWSTSMKKKFEVSNTSELSKNQQKEKDTQERIAKIRKGKIPVMKTKEEKIRIETRKEFEKEIEISKKEIKKGKVSKEQITSCFMADLTLKAAAAKCDSTEKTVNRRANKFYPTKDKKYLASKRKYEGEQRKIDSPKYFPQKVKMPVGWMERISGVKIINPEVVTNIYGEVMPLNFITVKHLRKICGEKALCPILANNAPTDNWQGYTLMGNEVFHPEITSIPYYNYNPIKRLRRGASFFARGGDFVIEGQSEDYFKENYTKMIFLKVRIAKSDEELYLTSEGGIIISEKASNAMRYDFVVRHEETQKEVVKFIVGDNKTLENIRKKYPSDRLIRAGEIIEGTNYDFPLTGYMLITDRIKTKIIKGKKYSILNYRIAQRGKIQVGDKLMSLTGLKGMVAKVDPELDVDIVISPNEIYGIKESKWCGALAKEILTMKKIGVFFISSHLSNSSYSKIHEGTEPAISSTSYSYFARFGSKELKKNILVNHRLADLFYMLDLVLDEEGRVHKLNRDVKSRKGGERIFFNHILWNKDFIKKEIWIPNWYPSEWIAPRKEKSKTGEETKTELRKTPSTIYDAIKRFAKIGEIKDKDLTEAKITEKDVQFARFLNEMVVLIKKYMRPLIKDGQGRANLIAIPKDGNPYEIELTKYDIKLMGLKDGQKVLLRREPTLSKTHIQELVVKETKDRFQSENVIKLNLEVMKLMAGDTDGDPLILIFQDSEGFKVPQEIYDNERKIIEKYYLRDFRMTEELFNELDKNNEIPEKYNRNFSICKEDIEKLFQTQEELLAKAETEHNKQRKINSAVPRLGGYKRHASFAQDSIDYENEVEPLNIYLEDKLKDVASFSKVKVKEKDLEEAIEVWLEARRTGVKDNVLSLFWKKDVSRYSKKKKLSKQIEKAIEEREHIFEKIEGMKIVKNFRKGLYRDLVSKIEVIKKW